MHISLVRTLWENRSFLWSLRFSHIHALAIDSRYCCNEVESLVLFPLYPKRIDLASSKSWKSSSFTNSSFPQGLWRNEFMYEAKHGDGLWLGVNKSATALSFICWSPKNYMRREKGFSFGLWPHMYAYITSCYVVVMACQYLFLESFGCMPIWPNWYTPSA